MTKPTETKTKLPYERPQVTKKRPLVRATLFSAPGTSTSGGVVTVIGP